MLFLTLLAVFFLRKTQQEMMLISSVPFSTALYANGSTRVFRFGMPNCVQKINKNTKLNIQRLDREGTEINTKLRRAGADHIFATLSLFF